MPAARVDDECGSGADLDQEVACSRAAIAGAADIAAAAERLHNSCNSSGRWPVPASGAAHHASNIAIEATEDAAAAVATAAAAAATAFAAAEIAAAAAAGPAAASTVADAFTASANAAVKAAALYAAISAAAKAAAAAAAKTCPAGDKVPTDCS